MSSRGYAPPPRDDRFAPRAELPSARPPLPPQPSSRIAAQAAYSGSRNSNPPTPVRGAPPDPRGDRFASIPSGPAASHLAQNGRRYDHRRPDEPQGRDYARRDEGTTVRPPLPPPSPSSGVVPPRGAPAQGDYRGPAYAQQAVPTQPRYAERGERERDRYRDDPPPGAQPHAPRQQPPTGPQPAKASYNRTTTPSGPREPSRPDRPSNDPPRRASYERRPDSSSRPSATRNDSPPRHPRTSTHSTSSHRRRSHSRSRSPRRPSRSPSRSLSPYSKRASSSRPTKKATATASGSASSRRRSPPSRSPPPPSSRRRRRSVSRSPLSSVESFVSDSDRDDGGGGRGGKMRGVPTGPRAEEKRRRREKRRDDDPRPNDDLDEDRGKRPREVNEDGDRKGEKRVRVDLVPPTGPRDRSPLPPPSGNGNGGGHHHHESSRPFYPTQGPVSGVIKAVPGPIPPSTSSVVGTGAMPPTEPRALREKLLIGATSKTPPTDAPKGPKGRAVQLGGASKVGVVGGGKMAGVPTGPRGSQQVKKFFPGDEDEEEELVVARKPNPVKNGWVMDVEKRGGPVAPPPRGAEGKKVEPVEPEAEKEVDRENGGSWGRGQRRNEGAPDVPPPRDAREARDDRGHAPSRASWPREEPRAPPPAPAAAPPHAYLTYPPQEPVYAPPGPSAYERRPYVDPRQRPHPPPPVDPYHAAPSSYPLVDRAPPPHLADARRTGWEAAPQAYPTPTEYGGPPVGYPAQGHSYPPAVEPHPEQYAPYADPHAGYPDPRVYGAPPVVDPRDPRNAPPEQHEKVQPQWSEPEPQLAPASDAPAPALPSGELYERLVQVGEGTYGKVFKAKNVETGALVALKRIRMEAEKDGFPVTAIREIKLLQNLRHPNVVDLIEMMVAKDHVYMVLGYMDHDLTGVLHHPSINFTPAHLKSLMKQFLDGLGFIHRRGVLHRDLKGSNILLSKNGELKIADFGLARFFARGRNNDYTNRVITQWYKPPELLFGTTVYAADVDMWSAGCIFLELFARRPIFQGQDEIHQLEVIFKVTGTPNVASWPGLQELPWYELVKPKTVIESQLRETFSKWLSPAGLDVAERLLSLDPAKRPTADEALDMEYFREDPQPEMPDVLADVKGEWHEYESKRARKRQREEAG